MNDDFAKRLTSRKFLFTLALFLVVISNGIFELGLEQADIYTLFGIVGSYVGVEGLNDIMSRVPEAVHDIESGVEKIDELTFETL
jgi:hypothetical protein